MVKWLCLTGAIVAEVSATLSLRAMIDEPRWLTLVVTGYLLSFVFLGALLRLKMPVGVVYGIWSGSGVALTAAAATILFGDPLTWLMGAGFVAIIAGVLLIHLGSTTPEVAGASMSEAS